jgi:predicted PurR-regulated permease PerM
MQIKKTKINIRLLIVFLSFFVLLFLLYILREVMLPFVIALILAYLISPLVNFLERRGARRIFSIILIFVVLAAAAIVGTGLFIDYAGREALTIQKKFPQITEKIGSFVKEFSDYVSRLAPVLDKEELKGALIKGTVKVSENMGGYIAKYFSAFLESLGWLFSRVLNLFVILFVLFFLLKDWVKIKAAAIRSINTKYRSPVTKLATNINLQVSNYIRGQIMVAVLVGILSTAGLFLLGFDFAFILGAIVGLTNLIPVMGPLMGVFVGLLMSVFSAQPFLISATEVVAVFAIVHILDNTIISPLVIGFKVRIHPITVVLSLSLGWYFLGIIGMFIAIPFYTSMKLILTEMYKYYS